MSPSPRGVALGLCFGLAASMAVAAERRQTPDVRVSNVLVQEAVLCGQAVPVRVVLHSTGYAGRTVELVALREGKELARTAIVLAEGLQFAEAMVPPEKRPGVLRLEVRASPLPGDAAPANNAASVAVRVVGGMLKVLYVEGIPRWEYRYLRGLLLRDAHVDAQFLLTEGDPALARVSPRDLAKFPQARGELFRFDVVILGDVSARFFTRAQLADLHDLVARQGGALLVLAGPRHGLKTCLGTPLGALLPVTAGPETWHRVDGSVHPAPTEAGWRSGIFCLAKSRKQDRELWQRVRPIHKVPSLAGAKPAAAVLATLSDASRRKPPYPLVAWQCYGSGRVLFVGTDQLWRLRYQEGDKRYVRFWRQALRFVALSRLLPPGRIRLATDRRSYSLGDPVQIFANVLDESYRPASAPAYTVHIEAPDGEAGPLGVRLAPVAGLAGLYHGQFIPKLAGRYRLRPGPPDQDASSPAVLHVHLPRLPPGPRAK